MGNKLHLAAVATLAMVASFTCLAKQSADSSDEPSARTRPVWRQYTGTVMTDVVAIGGETTGIVLFTETQGAIELDCGNNRSLLRKVEQLNGEVAVVEGAYREFPGVEIETRRVIRVQSIQSKKKK